MRLRNPIFLLMALLFHLDCYLFLHFPVEPALVPAFEILLGEFYVYACVFVSSILFSVDIFRSNFQFVERESLFLDGECPLLITEGCS